METAPALATAIVALVAAEVVVTVTEIAARGPVVMATATVALAPVAATVIATEAPDQELATETEALAPAVMEIAALALPATAIMAALVVAVVVTAGKPGVSKKKEASFELASCY